jgi:uridine kinase
MSIIQVTDALLSKMQSHDPKGHSFLVGIDGLGGAGKTTFVKKLKQQLDSRNYEVIVLHIDNYIVERTKRYKTGHEEWYEYYHLQWDIRLMETELFKKLHTDSNHLTLPFYENTNDTILPKQITVRPGSIILIEGIFIQRTEWRDYFDFVIFVDCDQEVRVNRVLNRDTYIGDYKIRLEKYKKRYWVAEEYYIKNENPLGKADYIYRSK